MAKRGRGEKLTMAEKASIRRMVLVEGLDYADVGQSFGIAEITVRRVSLGDGTCTKCLKNQSEPGRKRCSVCKPAADRSWRKSSDKNKIRKAENRKNGLCGCGNKTELGFRKCPECRFERQSNVKRRRSRLKFEALKAYGGECYCCGEDNPRLLTIDHVNNDGHAMRKSSQKKLVVRTGRNEQFIFVEIIDSGCGIRKEDQSKLFEPFYSTKARKGEEGLKGTGLGLYSSYQLLRPYGVTFDVQSEADKGTCFRVLFPSALAVQDAQNSQIAQDSQAVQDSQVVQESQVVQPVA
jgi:hypothetical protein